MAETVTAEAPAKSGGFFSKLWQGLTGTVSDVANSDSVQSLLGLGERYFEDEMARKAREADAEYQRELLATKQTALPTWAAPVGVGLAAVLVVVLIASMARRGR
jgi:hypothetical protein